MSTRCLSYHDNSIGMPLVSKRRRLADLLNEQIEFYDDKNSLACSPAANSGHTRISQPPFFRDNEQFPTISGALT